MRRHQGKARWCRDILGQFEMDRTRPLLLGDAERLPHDGGNGGSVYDLVSHLGQWRNRACFRLRIPF